MDFQPEIIRLVLSHLTDLEDLKKCLLVSEEIREIIIKTPELMRQLTLILVHDTWKNKLQFVEKYGFFVRALKFDDIGFENHEEYMKILRQTPNLERLIVDDCYISSERETDNDNENDEQENNEENNDAEANQQEIIIDGRNENLAGEQDQLDIAEQPVVQEDVQPVENIVEMPPEPDVLEEDENRENSANENINNFDENDVNLNENREIVQNNEIQAEALQANFENGNQDSTNDVNENRDEFEPLNLKHLNHLHLESSTISESIVKSLSECNKLKFLKLTFFYQQPVTIFTDFLCRQDELETLDLQGWSEMVFKCLFKDDIRNKVKFKLKKFSLECEMSYNTNFSNFLRSQAEYIRELELLCYNINFHYYRMIFYHFHNLVKLNFPIDWFLTDARVNSIKDCRINSLKELELIGANDDLTTFKTVLNIFPNIEILKCENLQNFSMYGILEKFTKLKTIRSENFRCETMLFVKIPSLTSLETGFLYPFALDFLWQNLAEDCPNLENIQIEDIGLFKLNESVRAEFAILLKNLKHFKKLKTCKILCSPQENTVNSDHDANENENIQEHAFYKVHIKTEEKIIQISQYFAQNCTEEVQILRDTFKDCDINET